MFHVHSSCISNMKKQRQYLAKLSVSSKYRVEPVSKKGDVKDILNWLSIVQNVTPSF